MRGPLTPFMADINCHILWDIIGLLMKIRTKLKLRERNHRNYQYFSRPKIIHTNIRLRYFRLWTKYPAGQNVSLELMFGKFATTKNREKLNPLKVSSNRCICLKTALERCKIVQQLVFKPPTFRFLN